MNNREIFDKLLLALTIFKIPARVSLISETFNIDLGHNYPEKWVHRVYTTLESLGVQYENISVSAHTYGGPTPEVARNVLGGPKDR